MRQITERAMCCYIFLLPPPSSDGSSQQQHQPARNAAEKKPSFWKQADTASATASPVGPLQKAAEQKDFCCCHGGEGNSPCIKYSRKNTFKTKSISQRNFLFFNVLNCGHYFDSPTLQDNVLARASKKNRGFAASRKRRRRWFVASPPPSNLLLRRRCRRVSLQLSQRRRRRRRRRRRGFKDTYQQREGGGVVRGREGVRFWIAADACWAKARRQTGEGGGRRKIRN